MIDIFSVCAVSVVVLFTYIINLILDRLDDNDNLPKKVTGGRDSYIFCYTYVTPGEWNRIQNNGLNLSEMQVPLLFGPVPKRPHCINYIKKYRGDYLKNKVLLRIKVPSDVPVKLIGNGKSVRYFVNRDDTFWDNIWTSIMHRKVPENFLEGIPHAAVYPKDNIIPAKYIKRM